MSEVEKTVSDVNQDKPQRTKPAYSNDKEGRIIVRNLPFDLKEKHLVTAFSKFGVIVNTNVPIKNENNLNRGFGFVEFASVDEAKKAIAEMNGHKFKGRSIAVEFSLAKN
jgi:RNA recognition motif-containing protein